MRLLVPAVLVLVALIHALPAFGVFGAALYGVTVAEPNLEILLRHRAVLFGLLAAFLAWAAFDPALHRLALVAGVVSVGSFLGTTALVGQPNVALLRVLKVDVVALVLLLVAGACICEHPGSDPQRQRRRGSCPATWHRWPRNGEIARETSGPRFA